MKLTILGTGNAQAINVYNTCFTIEDEGKYLLVDAGGGNGVLTQFKKAGIDWKDLRHIFVTHKHIDHILGIVWMMRLITQNMNQNNYDGEAWIYAHDEVCEILKNLANTLLQKKQAAMIGDRLHIVEVHDGEEVEIIGHKTTFFDIGSTKAKQYGFSMELGNGEKLTCCGEEPYNEREEKYAKDSKWLMHEAFCLYDQRDIFHPYEKCHSTVKEAAELAETLNCPNLILYHTEDKNIPQRKELYTAEGKQYYHGNLFVPDDLEVFEL